MEHSRTEPITSVIAYIESHLAQKLDLDTVASAVHYSKYHLHRLFTQALGITPHDYIQRRQLTEAAKLLVFSKKPILEIALIAGYESQQAFTGIFKSMYKQTPMEYRERQVFYPLQLRFTLQEAPSAPDILVPRISFVTLEEISHWMEFAALVIGGFPCFDPTEHQERLRDYIHRKQALMAWDKETVIGAAAWSGQTGSIDFLAVHPQYRHHQIGKVLLDSILPAMAGREITITTFRAGDKADTGQRAAYQQLGFAEAELLTEYGYPVQRMRLSVAQDSNLGKGGDSR